MKQIQVSVMRGANFSPSSLMNRYAKQTPGVEFRRSCWGSAQLVIDGRPYAYHHWSITAQNSAEIVTLYLEEVISHGN